ncbi:MAG: hypothetical protein HRT87_06710 [Legionellales bacterium]|nr:hypothetical protein [Legionellales bacterium]
MKQNNSKAMRSRGFVTATDIIKFEHLPDSEILNLLQSNVATQRTIAAKIILKKSNATEFIDQLINAISIEKKLYPRIAISETLGSLGKISAEKCIPLLGKIGNNQHVNLPTKKFNKNNYPLPRDIIARSICKIGNIAIPVLLNKLDTNNSKQLSEGIDALGYISYYQKNYQAKDYILKLTTQYNNNPLIMWKLIRALQAFPCKDVVKYLLNIAQKTTNKQLIWESKRSLQQIQNSKT